MNGSLLAYLVGGWILICIVFFATAAITSQSPCDEPACYAYRVKIVEEKE